MTQMVDPSADSDRAAEIRNALTDQLRADGMITSPVVERAFRTVPRHLFVPEDTPLEVAYHADDSVTIKTDQDGAIISSISAPLGTAAGSRSCRPTPSRACPDSTSQSTRSW